LGMNTKLGPLTKKALKDRMVLELRQLACSQPYRAFLYNGTSTRKSRFAFGRTSEAALDALEKVLTLPPDRDAVVRKMVEELK